LEIATGRRTLDLLDVETSDPAQLSVEPLAEDRTQQELQRLALKAHQKARQAAGLVHVGNSVMRVSQSKIRRDHDEWHGVAVPGLDNPDPVPLAVEDADDYEPDIAEHAEAYFGEQTHMIKAQVIQNSRVLLNV